MNIFRRFTLAAIITLFMPLMVVSAEGKLEQRLIALEEDAREGGNEALYTLGYIYIQPSKDSEADLDKAYGYLVKVEGIYENAARILIGYIYAEGTKNIKIDLNKTEKIFNGVSLKLQKEFEEITELGKKQRSLSEEDLKDFMQRSIQAQSDYNLLHGHAAKYGIKLD